MNEHVEAQQGNDAGSVNLGRRIVADGRNIDDAVKQTGSAQYLIECYERGLPPSHRIALGTKWFGCERPKEKHVMETDHMLQDVSGVPLTAW